MVELTGSEITGERKRPSRNLTMTKVARVAGPQSKRSALPSQQTNTAMAAAYAHVLPVLRNSMDQVSHGRNARAASTIARRPDATQASATMSEIGRAHV